MKKVITAIGEQNLNEEDYYYSTWSNLQNIIDNLQDRYQTQAEIDAKVIEIQNAIKQQDKGLILIFFCDIIKFQLHKVMYFIRY